METERDADLGQSSASMFLPENLLTCVIAFEIFRRASQFLITTICGQMTVI